MAGVGSVAVASAAVTRALPSNETVPSTPQNTPSTYPSLFTTPLYKAKNVVCRCDTKESRGGGGPNIRDMPQLPEEEEEEEGGGISLWEGGVGHDGNGYTGPFEDSER